MLTDLQFVIWNERNSYFLGNRHNTQCLILFDKNGHFGFVCLLSITVRASQTSNLNICTVLRANISRDETLFVKQEGPFELALLEYMIWFKTKTLKDYIRFWRAIIQADPGCHKSSVCNRLDKKAGKSSRLVDHVTDWSAGEVCRVLRIPFGVNFVLIYFLTIVFCTNLSTEVSFSIRF